jgi:pimeloyl-ACP methyl ester carboxylesterase
VYDDNLFISQLSNLIFNLKWTKNIDIIGYSLGGAITAGFVSRFPEAISRVIFIAPAGIMKGMPAIASLLHIPIIGPLFIHTIGAKIQYRLSVSNHLFTFEECPPLLHFNAVQKFQIENHPGLVSSCERSENFNWMLPYLAYIPSLSILNTQMRAFASTVVNFPFQNQHHHFHNIQKTHAGRVLCLWGSLDRVVPTDLAGDLKACIPSVVLHVKEGNGHSIVMESPGWVVDHIWDFLQ